jgi:hypothetical protein
MEFVFDEFVQDAGLSDNAIKCLQKAELHDIKALLCVDVSDLNELKLSPGDQGKLKYSLRVLRDDNVDFLHPRRGSKVLIQELNPDDDHELFDLRPRGAIKKDAEPQKYSVEEVTALLENQRISLQKPSNSHESASLFQRDYSAPVFLGGGLCAGQASTRSLGRDDCLRSQ